MKPPLLVKPGGGRCANPGSTRKQRRKATFPRPRCAECQHFIGNGNCSAFGGKREGSFPSYCLNCEHLIDPILETAFPSQE